MGMTEGRGRAKGSGSTEVCGPSNSNSMVERVKGALTIKLEPIEEAYGYLINLLYWRQKEDYRPSRVDIFSLFGFYINFFIYEFVSTTEKILIQQGNWASVFAYYIRNAFVFKN